MHGPCIAFMDLGSIGAGGWLVGAGCWLVLRLIARLDAIEKEHAETRAILDEISRKMELYEKANR